MQTILTVIQVFLSIGLIGLVLIQHGRGADAGAAFGSGASATVFGARGSGSFLSRATGIIAALFFLTSMAMAYYAAQGGKPKGLMDGADGTVVRIESPVKVPAPTAASQSEVPTVPGVAFTATGSDVPAVPVDAGAAGAKVPAGDVPAAPAPAVAVPDQAKAPEKAPENPVSQDKTDEPPKSAMPDAAAAVPEQKPETKPDAVPSPTADK